MNIRCDSRPLQAVDASHLFKGKVETGDREVADDPIGVRRLRDYGNAVLQVPRDDDLGRGRLVRMRNLDKDWVVKAGLPERAVRFDSDPALSVLMKEIGVIPGGIKADLIDIGHAPRDMAQEVKLRDTVVAYPYRCSELILGSGQELAPSRDVLVSVF